MNFFTGNKDTDFIILSKLSDNEIKIVRRVSKYMHFLCSDSNFWKNRILNRVKKGYEELLKLGCNTLIFDVNQLDVIKKYFGFSKYRELSYYFNEFSNEKVLPFIYLEHDIIDVEAFYNIDKTKLYKFINHEELIFYLRRELNKNYYATRSDNVIVTPLLNIEGVKETQGRKIMRDGNYGGLVKVGIRK